eukprot:NODE_28_length_33831_cov_0.361200.p6 type:complete len:588 gc:universal NODE_28_length_33831_cov_0.361200:5176-3413(-)
MSISALRQLLVKKNLGAFIVPSEDAHFSEYVHPCDARRSFISKFSGSAGLAIITVNEAALWTDGRYFLQAESQLPSEFTLMKSGTPGCMSKEEWLKEKVPQGSVAIDPETIPYAEYLELKKSLLPLSLVLSENLVDEIWTDRPLRPTGNKYKLSLLDNTGRSSSSKFKSIVAELANKKASAAVFGMLDDIAYILNLRGSDVPFNPVFFSYLVVESSKSHLFIDSSKLSGEVMEYLNGLHLDIHKYDSNLVADLLKSINGPIIVDSRCNTKIVSSCSSPLIQDRSVAYMLKSIKTNEEMNGFRQCHIRDAVALSKFFHWLSTHYKSNKITEYDASIRLKDFRAQQSMFKGESFDSIIGMKGNGAIIHYKPDSVNSAVIVDGCLLVDSGGQYSDGTTDITRTVWLGSEKPTEFLKECYTRVLQGHISIDQIKFPKGTTGYQVDALARQHLWKVGLDYQHGTGHGVGHYLCVHEGPHGIGFRKQFDLYELKEGMTITNEPGYYEPKEFGIRIENILLICKVDGYKKPQSEWLGFENVTVFPLEQRLVNIELLTVSEKKWFNEYQQRCLEVLLPRLEGDAREWLKEYTKFV